MEFPRRTVHKKRQSVQHVDWCSAEKKTLEFEAPSSPIVRPKASTKRMCEAEFEAPMNPKASTERVCEAEFEAPSTPIVSPNASTQRVCEADSIAKHRGYVDIANKFAGINVTFPKLQESPIFIKRRDVMFSSFI